MKDTIQYTLGIVIAKRELDFINNGVEKKIIIKIGKPRKDREIRGGYYCPFIISGLGKENIQIAFGTDSVQSIESAFNMIGLIMTLNYQKLYPNKITWNNDSRLGFPLPDTLDEIIKKERQWMKKLKK